jgi:hypothetical protein
MMGIAKLDLVPVANRQVKGHSQRQRGELKSWESLQFILNSQFLREINLFTPLY